MERRLQNLPMFLFCTAIALGRPLFKRRDEGSGQISHDELSHGHPPEGYQRAQ
jgi:hypothetical protein